MASGYGLYGYEGRCVAIDIIYADFDIDSTVPMPTTISPLQVLPVLARLSGGAHLVTWSASQVTAVTVWGACVLQCRGCGSWSALKARSAQARGHCIAATLPRFLDLWLHVVPSS